MTMTDTGRDLRDAAHDVGDDIASGASKTKAAVKNAAADVIDDVEDFADDTQEVAESGLSRALTAVEDAVGWTGTQFSAIGTRLQERPLQTAAMALAAGAIFGWFMRRR